jgi:excisionase family DNA binding protein
MVLTVRQAAERLQVAPATIYGLCGRQKLAHLRIGAGRGTIRIPEESLDAFVSGVTVRAEDSPAPPQPRMKLKHLKT